MFGKRLELCNVYGIKIGVDVSWFFIAVLLSWTLAAGYFPAAYPNLAQATYWTMGVVGMLGLFFASCSMNWGMLLQRVIMV